MRFPIEQVPIAKPTQPFQQPQGFDPGQLIMQAAQLNQQERQNQQKLQQEGINNILEAIKASQQLQEQKRAHLADESMAERTLALSEKKSEPHMELERAYAAYYNAMAGNKTLNLLTVQEAEALGVPYGTRRQEAIGKGTIPVSQSIREKLSETTNPIGLLDSLEKQFKKLNIGEDVPSATFRGGVLQLESMAPSTDAGIYSAQRNNISLIVRAMGERGVLTDQDVARIHTNIPGFYDTKTSANQKMSTLRGILSSAQANMKKGLVGDVLKKQETTNLGWTSNKENRLLELKNRR